MRQNLESEGFFLLLGCSKPQWELFSDLVKAVHVELPPLSPLESATLFLQRCHRPLTLEDVLRPNSEEERVVRKEALPKERAKQLLKPMVSVFEGDPRLIRQAAGKVTPTRPPLMGDLRSLKVECISALAEKFRGLECLRAGSAQLPWQRGGLRSSLSPYPCHILP